MEHFLSQYAVPLTSQEVDNQVRAILQKTSENFNLQNLVRCFSCLDLTTLNVNDTSAKVAELCRKVDNFYYAHLPEVAAICVYPSLVAEVKLNLHRSKVKIAAVSGGFPSSQTFLEVKVLETMLTVEKGANEIDMVISVGKFLEKNYQTVCEEIRAMKMACKNAHLKVILETGALNSVENIYIASILAIESGADFIKTSTGKISPAATHEAVFVMANVVRQYFQRTGKKIGIKPAGGISTSQQAIEYFSIMKNVLGDQWLDSSLFRIGASTLADNLLTDIHRLKQDSKENSQFFNS